MISRNKDFQAGILFMTNVLLAAEKQWTDEDYIRGLQLLANGHWPRATKPNTEMIKRHKEIAKDILLNP